MSLSGRVTRRPSSQMPRRCLATRAFQRFFGRWTGTSCCNRSSIPECFDFGESTSAKGRCGNRGRSIEEIRKIVCQSPGRLLSLSLSLSLLWMAIGRSLSAGGGWLHHGGCLFVVGLDLMAHIERINECQRLLCWPKKNLPLRVIRGSDGCDTKQKTKNNFSSSIYSGWPRLSA